MRALGRTLVLALAAFVFLALGAEAPASAQSTGSSMGGGSFSSGSSYSGGSSYSSGYSGGSDHSSDYSGGYGYSSSSSYSGGSGSDAGGVFGLVIAALLIVIGLVLPKVAARSAIGTNTAYQRQKMDLTVLSLAVDWRARALIQKEFDRIARTCDTSNTSGLLRMLRETTVTLRRVRSSWIYAGAENYPPMKPNRAEQAFQSAAQEARTRFLHELVRNEDGALVERDRPDIEPHSHEGEGVVVVTLVIAARSEFVDVHTPGDAEIMRGALEALGSLSSRDLVAVEIIWSPAAMEDRMSTVELEALYPELHRIQGATLVGRVYCAYCGGPFPKELLSCPHCGAVVETDEPSAA